LQTEVNIFYFFIFLTTNWLSLVKS